MARRRHSQARVPADPEKSARRSRPALALGRGPHRRYAIPPETPFAIHLCLEEALSNVIRHGYSGQPGHTLTVDCASPNAHELVFTIEDHAPPFDPLAASVDRGTARSRHAGGFSSPGGRGIRLMRKFAGPRLPAPRNSQRGRQSPHHRLRPAPLAFMMERFSGGRPQASTPFQPARSPLLSYFRVAAQPF